MRKQGTREPKPTLHSLCNPRLSTRVTPTGNHPADPPTLILLPWPLGTDLPASWVVLKIQHTNGRTCGKTCKVHKTRYCGSYLGLAAPSTPQKILPSLLRKLSQAGQHFLAATPAIFTNNSQGRRDVASFWDLPASPARPRAPVDRAATTTLPCPRSPVSQPKVCCSF